MKCLLIIAPFLEPYRPPLSGAIIYEVVKSAGHDITIKDLNIDMYHYYGSKKFYDLQLQFSYFGDKKDDSIDTFLEEQLTGGDYDLILISAFSFQSHTLSYKICQHLRKRYTGKILYGGPATHYPMVTDKPEYIGNKKIFGEMLKEENLIDHYITGEGEIALKEFLNGNLTYPGIDSDKFIQIENLDELPFPNYDGLDLSRYEYLLEDKKDFFIYGSRGCVRRCTFCDIHTYWPKFRYRSGTNIAQEMIAHYERYGVKNFYFADSLFNGSLKAFTDFLTSLSKYPHCKDFSWGGMSIIRPKNQHPPEMYDMIAESGTSFWVTGVETFVDRVRFEMGKKFTNEDIIYHLEESSRVGLQNVFLFIPTWVSETEKEHEEYVAYFSKLKKYIANGSIISASFSPRLIIMENTELFRYPNLVYPTEALAKSGLSKEYYWYNPKNPTLNIKERCNRTYNVLKAAMDNKWPIMHLEQKLNDLNWLVESVIKNPELEFRIDNT